ncbi:MAG: hypothetical protein PHY08_09470 [Candidatus Cloacimonetes bacterium]|nr:hypothetical protein [Candidatus Cloacimonadota bacterium]MDD4156787.1 hypothetical protein [Candidatus Cloacimonadota bacterium]
MHLRVLKAIEKISLLELAYKMFNIDNEYSEHEKYYFNVFKSNTMLDLKDYQIKDINYHEIIRNLKESSMLTKMLIFRELAYLMYTEHKPSDKEIKFLSQLRKDLNIDEIEETKLIKQINEEKQKIVNS